MMKILYGDCDGHGGLGYFILVMHFYMRFKGKHSGTDEHCEIMGCFSVLC